MDPSHAATADISDISTQTSSQYNMDPSHAATADISTTADGLSSPQSAAIEDEGPSLHTVVDIPGDGSLATSVGANDDTSITTTVGTVGVQDAHIVDIPDDHSVDAGSITPPPHIVPAPSSPDHIVVIDDDSITPIISSTSLGVQDVGPISPSAQTVDISDDDSGLPSGLRSALASIEAANSVDPSLPRGLRIALFSHAAGSQDSSTPVPDYGKWIEHLTWIIIILTGLVSMANTPLPREGPGQRHTRASLLVAVCALLLVLTVIKIALEHIQDKAGWIYYHTKRGHKKIFYWKMIGHILGLLLITCSFSVAATAYIASKYNEGLVAAYVLNMCSLALSAAQNVIQERLKPKKNDLTERTTNGVIFRSLRACRDIPPYYRTGLYEIDPEKLLVLEVD